MRNRIDVGGVGNTPFFYFILNVDVEVDVDVEVEVEVENFFQDSFVCRGWVRLLKV